jgi:hypothetical protein
MRKYASASPDSRELVDELEFVWDQVKSNVPTSNSSSPVHTGNETKGLGISPSGSKSGSSGSPHGSEKPSRPPALSFIDRLTSAARGTNKQPQPNPTSQPLQPIQPLTRVPLHSIKTHGADLRQFTSSPLSQSALGDESSDEEDDPADFVDAPDSQIAENETPPPYGDLTRQNSGMAGSIAEPFSSMAAIASSSKHPLPTVQFSNKEVKPVKDKTEELVKSPTKQRSAARARHRAKIESTLTRLTAEVAALREQLDLSYSRSFSFSNSRFFPSSSPGPDRLGLWARLLLGGLSFLAKVFIVDMLALVLVLVWMRRAKDGRLEGAVRVLLGDAVAVVQRGVREASKGVERVGRVVGKNMNMNIKAGVGKKPGN